MLSKDLTTEIDPYQKSRDIFTDIEIKKNIKCIWTRKRTELDKTVRITKTEMESVKYPITNYTKL